MMFSQEYPGSRLVWFVVVFLADFKYLKSLTFMAITTDVQQRAVHSNKSEQAVLKLITDH